MDADNQAVGIAPEEIRGAVRRPFDRVAEAPGAGYRFQVGPSLALAAGYEQAVLRSLPPEAAESFTGLVNPHPYLDLQPGERVLDAGAGGGLDSILAARAVAPGGTVTGMDLSGGMVARAGALAAGLAVPGVDFIEAAAEGMPFPDGAFDVAFANGLLNLCPDKGAVARELWRVLAPGGRAVVAEITYLEPPPARRILTVEDWFR